MNRFVLWAHRRRALVLLSAVVVFVLSILGVRGLTFDTDVLRLLPRDGQAIPPFRTFLERFGSLDTLYVVFTAPNGHSARDYEGEIGRWVEELRKSPEIERVDAGTVDASRNWGYLADRQLLLLKDASLERAIGRFDRDGMSDALRNSRELLAVPSPAVADLVRQDPLELFGLLRKQLGAGMGGLGIGATVEGYFSTDGRQRLVLVRPARPPYDTEFSRALFTRLALIEAKLRSTRTETDEPEEVGEPRPPLHVEFAGGHRIAVEIEQVVRRESILNGVGSLALILPLLYIVFRSVWLVAIGAIPSVLSLLVVLGGLGLAGATLSAAATGASAMLFGLGVDGVVLLYVSHRLALNEGKGAEEAVAGIAGPSSSMLLGMWTTAATFYGLMAVDFPSLEQLGRLIGHSMVVCGLLTLVLVPACLQRRARASARCLTLPALAAFVRRRSGAVLVAAGAITLLLGWASTGLRVNPTLDRLRAVTPGATLERQIGAAFGLPSEVYILLTEGTDLEALLRENETLVDTLVGEVPGLRYEAPSLLLPSQQEQARRAALISRDLPPVRELRSALRAAAEEHAFHPGAFAPFEERLPRLTDTAHRVTFDGYVENGLADIVRRFVVRSDERWALATYMFPETPAQVASLEHVAGRIGGTGRLTGLALVNRELAQRFVPQFLLGLGVGSVLVVCLIVLSFRNLKLSLLSLLPTAVGLLWAAGLLGLARIELDLFAVFAVLTFVGIGVDYGVHLVHRYKERGNAERACAELAPVILVAGLITLLGYGTLMTSSYPPLRSIGVVSVVSVVALIGSSIFVLPALLARGDR